jgi:hypothetical protein
MFTLGSASRLYTDIIVGSILLPSALMGAF